eukprot:991282-Alexandrium_andersonii.AAC.1
MPAMRRRLSLFGRAQPIARWGWIKSRTRLTLALRPTQAKLHWNMVGSAKKTQAEVLRSLPAWGVSLFGQGRGLIREK